MSEPTLEAQVRAWRDSLESSGDMGREDLDELESHLVDEVSDLRERGLSESEAFLVATRRIGRSHELSREYFKAHVNKLWKRLAVPEETARIRGNGRVVVALAAAAALFSQLPYLLGGSYSDPDAERWLMFASLWVMPSLIAYFGVRHRLGARRLLPSIVVFALIILYLVFFSFPADSSTLLLEVVHLPFLSWLLLLPPAVDRSRPSVPDSVHYLRFTGEAFVYAVLIGLGGASLIALTTAIFQLADIDIEHIIGNHVAVAGVFSVPVVAVALADRKRQVVENFAPTLARIFIPLFATAIGAFLITIAVTGTRPSGDRDLLLVMNILLLLVVAMLFYDVSAREAGDRRGASDWANLSLIVAALILDGVTLSAISSRLLEYGASPNRAAVFGLNVILLVHLVLLVVTYLRHLTGRVGFRSIEAAVVRMLPVYGAWLFVVVVLFPAVFGGA